MEFMRVTFSVAEPLPVSQQAPDRRLDSSFLTRAKRIIDLYH